MTMPGIDLSPALAAGLTVAEERVRRDLAAMATEPRVLKLERELAIASARITDLAVALQATILEVRRAGPGAAPLTYAVCALRRISAAVPFEDDQIDAGLCGELLPARHSL
jgi:hypothetical protein